MMIDWVDIALQRWGDYYRDGNNGLGFPSCSVEARMQAGGFSQDNKGAQVPDLYVPQDIEKTEFAVLSLPDELRAAVNVSYTTRGTRQQQAKRLTKTLGQRVSRDRLNKMLDQSHQRIAGIFDGMKYNRY